MKYIRTKDGRIIDCEDTKWKHHATYGEQAQIYALAERYADTIEELCDEFVGVDKTKEHDKLSPLSLKSYCNYVAIYGAIWTEWGLKYVAKMNEEGELELL